MSEYGNLYPVNTREARRIASFVGLHESWPQTSRDPRSRNAGITDWVWLFMGSRDLNSGPHTFGASVSPIEPPPQPELIQLRS